jgi:hypothetical protein
LRKILKNSGNAKSLKVFTLSRSLKSFGIFSRKTCVFHLKGVGKVSICQAKRSLIGAELQQEQLTNLVEIQWLEKESDAKGTTEELKR